MDLTDRGKLLQNLIFMWHVIRASEHLLEIGAEKAKRVDPPLALYYLDHLREETNHHQWLTEDLQAAGIRTDELVPDVLAAAMVGSQYYYLYHSDPACLLGYMLVLEGNPMPLAEVERLESIHGKFLLRTLRYHAEHDPDHVKEIAARIARLPEATQALVKQNTVQTVYYINCAAKLIEG